MHWHIEVRSDLAVIGYNPEAADLDHPNGEVIGHMFYMHAQDADGHTRVWGWHRDKEELEREFVLFAPTIEDWKVGRPAYASKAWEEAHQDRIDAESERREYDVPKGFEPSPFHRVY